MVKATEAPSIASRIGSNRLVGPRFPRAKLAHPYRARESGLRAAPEPFRQSFGVGFRCCPSRLPRSSEHAPELRPFSRTRLVGYPVPHPVDYMTRVDRFSVFSRLGHNQLNSEA